MKITDIFLDEHRTLLARLDELAVLTRIDGSADPGGGSTDVWESPDALAAGLLLHAQLEEELLFGHLEPHLGDAGPLEVMRDEHEEIKALLAQLCAASHLRAAQAPAASLVPLAREHFAKEEQMLFPMAEQLLGEDLLAELGERHAAGVALGQR